MLLSRVASMDQFPLFCVRVRLRQHEICMDPPAGQSQPNTSRSNGIRPFVRLSFPFHRSVVRPPAKRPPISCGMKQSVRPQSNINDCFPARTGFSLSCLGAADTVWYPTRNVRDRAGVAAFGSTACPGDIAFNMSSHRPSSGFV